jgi:hypothetical protein
MGKPRAGYGSISVAANDVTVDKQAGVARWRKPTHKRERNQA